MIYFMLLSGLALFICSPMPEQQQVESVASAGSTARGSVYNGLTGRRIGAVAVHLTRMPTSTEVSTISAEQQYSAVSDTDGAFAFENVPAGRYLVSVDVPTGYSRGRTALTSREIIVPKGAEASGLNFALLPDTSISGRVKNVQGHGVPSVTVQALVEVHDTAASVARLVVVAQSNTDSSGRYVLGGLQGDRYFIRAVLADPQNQTAHLLPAAYWPSAPGLDTALSIDLVPGQSNAGVDIALADDPVFILEGEVDRSLLAAGARPDAVVLIPTDSRGTNMWAIAQTTAVADDLSFRIPGVSPGTYNLVALGPAPGRRVLASSPLSVGDSAPSRVLLLPVPTINVNGHVIAEGMANSDLAQPTLTLSPIMPVPTGASSIQPTIKQDGSFRIANIDPLQYVLRVTCAPDIYVNVIRLGGQRVMGQVLDLSHGGSELEIDLREGAAKVQGTVMSEQPSGRGARSAVAVVYTDNTYGSSGTATEAIQAPIRNHAFSVASLRPGLYHIVVTEMYDPDLFRSPIFRQEISGRVVTVDLDANQVKQVEVPVLREADIKDAALRAGVVVF